ncbi:hypothetical protein QT513_29040, partial [Metapseudomonas otitidis]
AGVVQRDALQNIVGELAHGGIEHALGAFQTGQGFTGVGYNAQPNYIATFDASRVARTSTETRPLNVTGCWIIKMGSGVTNPGAIDAAAVSSTYAALVTRVEALEGRPRTVGDGQVWMNMNASRVSGTTYTNTTGRPIFVHASIRTGAVSAVCNGVTITERGFHAAFVVPNGATYSVVFESAINGNWTELR